MVDDRIRLSVRLTPRAARDEITGYREGAILVRVTAPPVDGAANEALVRLLAKVLGVPKGAVTVTSGKTSRTKVVEIVGIEKGVVNARLGGVRQG